MLHITKMTKVLFINFDYAAFGDATQVENDPTCFFVTKGGQIMSEWHNHSTKSITFPPKTFLRKNLNL
jgi:hypothetical protein